MVNAVAVFCCDDLVRVLVERTEIFGRVDGGYSFNDLVTVVHLQPFPDHIFGDGYRIGRQVKGAILFDESAVLISIQ